jgi:hypothetical protein
MQVETKKVIEKKFRGALNAHKERHKEGLKELFEKFGIPLNSDTLTAYFLGVLRAISFDSVAFIEIRGIRWDELKEIAQEMKDEILSTANEIEKDP